MSWKTPVAVQHFFAACGRAMKYFTDIFTNALSHQRSTILQTLGWLIAILAPTTALSSWGSREWLSVVLACLLVASVLLYLVTFACCAIKNPDLLRSEKYSVQKMVLESNKIGDSLTGLRAIEEIGNFPAIEDKGAKNGP